MIFILALYLLSVVYVVTSKTELIKVDAAMKWTNAAEHCKTMNAVIASNITEITASESPWSGHLTVWIGVYEAVTKWAFIKGCYYLNEAYSGKVFTANLFQCQKLCEDYNYFAIPFNGTDCHCLKNALNRTCNCNEINCYQMHEFFLPNKNMKINQNCAIVEYCKDHKTIVRGFRDCSVTYKIVCDNGYDLGYRYGYLEAVNVCRDRGSFIKWFETCNFNGTPHWTSGRRGKVQLSLQAPDIPDVNVVLKSEHIFGLFSVFDDYSTSFEDINYDIDKVNVESVTSCFKLSRNYDSFLTSSEPCAMEYPFFCETKTTSTTSSKPEEISTLFEPIITTSSEPEELSTVFGDVQGKNITDIRPILDRTETKQGAIIAGVIVPVVAIIVILIVVLRVRQRMLKKDQENTSNIYTNASSNQTEEHHTYDDINNQSYERVGDNMTAVYSNVL